uniref:Uncharacterized protein n=1 Tax=Rhizophora mucronata TaxID=61149 RepID=A0A2P2PI09_RHIMU
MYIIHILHRNRHDRSIHESVRNMCVKY